MGTEFYDASKESKQQAAWNIYQGILTLNLSSADLQDLHNADKAASLIGEFFALSRKNAAVT